MSNVITVSAIRRQAIYGGPLEIPTGSSDLPLEERNILHTFNQTIQKVVARGSRSMYYFGLTPLVQETLSQAGYSVAVLSEYRKAFIIAW